MGMGIDADSQRLRAHLLREWLKEFHCEDACDVLLDAGFDSLGMLSSLDEEEIQMMEICLKDLPPVKQRRIMKKAEELSAKEGASDDFDSVSVGCMSDKKSADPAMRLPMPVPGGDHDSMLTARVVSNITVTTAATERDLCALPRKDEAKDDVDQKPPQMNNFTTPQAPGSPSKSPTVKVTPGRIDEVHPLHHIAILGGLLYVISGWVNGVGFQGFDGGVTHVTGTATKVGLKLASKKTYYFIYPATKVLSFLIGCTITGAYLGRGRLFKGGPRHAHLLLLVSVQFFAAFVAEEYYDNNFLGKMLLVMGSGVQNALTTLYSGAVIKTATVTSTVTDIGSVIGMILVRRDYRDLWKLKLLTVFLFCYIAGGFFGALCFDVEAISGPGFVRAEAKALLVPASVTLFLAVAWLVHLHYVEPDPRGYGLSAEVRWWKQPAVCQESRSSTVVPSIEPPRVNRRNSLYAGGLIAPAC
jgi:uncharacterized membrane protein YoaK (UPF0700 family)